MKSPENLNGSKNEDEAKLKAAHKVGYSTILSVGFLYLYIFGIGYLGSSIHKSEDGKPTDYGGIKIFRNVLMSIFGSSGEDYSKSILKVAHFGIILQLVCHMPFIYFIGREHILQCIDEHQNNNLSKMVDRIKSNISGDPRFFLAQRKFSLKSNSQVSQINFTDTSNKVDSVADLHSVSGDSSIDSKNKNITIQPSSSSSSDYSKNRS